MKDETSTKSVESTSETVAEKENPFEPHLSRTAIIRIAVLAGLSLAALRPVGWGILPGFSEQIDEKRAKEMSISAYVMKPIVMRQIADTIREVLDKK